MRFMKTERHLEVKTKIDLFCLNAVRGLSRRFASQADGLADMQAQLDALDEAITEMEAIDHDFYIYLDTDDEKISVVYRRKEGGYGLLQADNKVIL